MSTGCVITSRVCVCTCPLHVSFCSGAGLMASGFERARCELSPKNNNNNNNNIQKMEDVTSAELSNPAESLMASQRNPEEHAGIQQDAHVQIMYCKDLVYQKDTEFCFEELRAQRYYKALSEKATHLNKLKQDLQLQIEQKQRLLQQKNSSAPQQIVDEEAVSSVQTSDGSCESSSAPDKIHSEQESDSKRDRPSSTNRRSLKLPTLNLKAPRSKAELSTDRDSSISRSEEPILHGHWNKTLCRSPNDTCEFARAAQLASTPFGGTERQKLTDDLKKTACEAPQAPNTDAAPESRKLSPIQEISHDWGGTSFATVTQEHRKPTENTETRPALERSDVLSEDAVEAEDVCSRDVRSSLLDRVDMTSFSNFHRETGALPEASGHDDLTLGEEMLFYRCKLGKLEDYTLYSSSTGTVVMKVDSSSVPWDFFISSRIRASLSTDDDDDDDVQISCFLYDTGCVTLWRIPHGVTVEDLLTEPPVRQDLPLVVHRLLQMVKRVHSCQIVHGGLKPETLYFYHSDITALDLSSSVDLQLQTDVRSVQDFSSAQDYITQGLLTHSASPYQVDLMGVAEIVHMLVLNRPLKVLRGNAGWSLDEKSESHHSPVDPVWKDFFQVILNPGDLSTEVVLCSLIDHLKNRL